MKNQTQKGDALTVTAPAGGMVAGNGYLFGSIFGVAAETVAAGVQTTIWLVGCFTLTKAAAEAWTVGELVYAEANGTLTATATSNKLVGVAIAAAANPSSVGTVRLNGAFSQ